MRLGYSLIEIAIVITLIGILASFAASQYFSYQEAGNAALLQSAHGQLQAIVSQAVMLLQKPATQLSLKQISDAFDNNTDAYELTAPNLPAPVSASVPSTNQGQKMTISLKHQATSLSVEATIDACGNVCLVQNSLTGFTKYVLAAEPKQQCHVSAAVVSDCYYLKQS
jgi:prepilin-type N-terminal cleavage/methylation domain-containing protein